MAIINVDLDGVEAGMGGNGLLAPGTYPCRIVKTEAKRNSKNTGNVLVIEFETNDGTIVKDWISYEHESEKAQKIGRGQLKLLLECVGKTSNQLVKGTEIMHGIPMSISVVQEDSTSLKDDGTPYKNNVVKKYMPSGQAASGNNPPMPEQQGW
jgi:hypothetical protein